MTWRTITALAAAGVAGFVVRTATSPDRQAPGAGEVTRLANLERRIERVERSGLPRRRSGAHAPISPDDWPASPPTNADAPGQMYLPTAQTTPASPPPPNEEEQVADRLALLEDMVREGAAAPQLERETWAKVQAGLERPELAGTTLSGLACSATVCRVEAVHDTETEANRFCRSFGRELGFRSRFWTRTDLHDGRVRSLQFMAPAGHHLPRLPQDTEP